MTLIPEERSHARDHLGFPALDSAGGNVSSASPRHSFSGEAPQNKRLLERFVIRLGMCFRIYPDDISVLKTAFSEDIPRLVSREETQACFDKLQRSGFLVQAAATSDSQCYAVPADVLESLERAEAEQQNLSREEYRVKRKKEHALLAETFLSTEVSIVRRRRYQAEALVQFRKAEAWGKLEELFQGLSMHLFGTHDSYIGRSCIDIPEHVVRYHPSFAIAIAMANASAGVATNHHHVDDAFEKPRAAPFEEVESRIDNLVAVYGPQWAKQRTIDGKLFLGIHWMRHHRQRGDIASARDIAHRLMPLVREHVAKGNLPTESNLHWFENERGVLEFMDANWQEAHGHLTKTIDMTFSTAVPGQYVPRFACTVSSLQQALNGNRQEAASLFHMATSLLDQHSDKKYIEFTLDLIQLILCVDELDFERGAHLVRKLDKRLFRYEIWGVALRFVQLFYLLLDRHSAKQARLDLTHTSGPGLSRISPLSASHVRQAHIDLLHAFGQIQRSREVYATHPEVLHDESFGYARLHFLGGRYDRALRILHSLLNKEGVTPRVRGKSSALIVAIYVRLNDINKAENALAHCLEISIKAATLLPLALLPATVRNSVIKLAQEDHRWPRLAESDGLTVYEMNCRLKQVGQCFPEQALLVDLTQREQVILQMLDEGYPQVEIARREYVALSTIKKQITSLYRKLGAANRAEALKIASKLGLLAWQTR